MREHPIFGKWLAALAQGRARADVLAELARDQFNPLLLDVPPAAVVPDMPAATVSLGEWGFLLKYTKMLKVVRGRGRAAGAGRCGLQAAAGAGRCEQRAA